jgi:hypothetical protein
VARPRAAIGHVTIPPQVSCGKTKGLIMCSS